MSQLKNTISSDSLLNRKHKDSYSAAPGCSAYVRDTVLELCPGKASKTQAGTETSYCHYPDHLVHGAQASFSDGTVTDLLCDQEEVHSTGCDSQRIGALKRPKITHHTEEEQGQVEGEHREHGYMTR